MNKLRGLCAEREEVGERNMKQYTAIPTMKPPTVTTA